MIHKNEHELSGKTVVVNVNHPYILANSEFTVEDWWDRVSGRSWRNCIGNPACLHYALYCIFADKPLDLS